MEFEFASKDGNRSPSMSITVLVDATDDVVERIHCVRIYNESLPFAALQAINKIRPSNPEPQTVYA